MIRQFVPEDLDEVMQIWLKTNQEAHNFISPDYWSSHYDMEGNAASGRNIRIRKR